MSQTDIVKTQNHIIVESVFFSYETEQPTVLQEIKLEIPKGQIVGLLGPNGAGKTTLIKLIAGLLKPTQGHISVLGQNPFLDASVRQHLGVMHQTPGFEQMLTGWENLYIFGRFFDLSPSDVSKTVRVLEESLGPFPYFERPIITYSGGERRRLQIIRALLGRPSILLLDEPTVGIDVHGRFQFYSALQDILAQYPMTIIWTTHYLEEVERNCERVILLVEGTIKIDASIQVLKGTVRECQLLVTVMPESINSLSDEEMHNLSIAKIDSSTISWRGENEAKFYGHILPILLDKGLQIESITKQEPSLEEIYLQLTQTSKAKQIGEEMEERH